MEKKRLFATLLGVGLAVGTPWQGFAQEQAAPQQAAEQPAEAAMPPQEVTDAGVEAVRDAQETEIPEVKREDAASVLEKMLEAKGWVRGWDENKQRFIAIGVAEIPVRITNPAKTRDLQIYRRTAAMHAILQAKSEIISYMRQEVSAEQQVIIPGTDLNKAMNAEVESLMNQVNYQKEVLADLLEKKDKAEADKLRGTTFGDRLDDLMVAAIKKLDKEYTGKEKDKVLAARYEEAVKAYKAEYAHYQDLVKRAKAKRKDVVQTFSNSVKSMAAMPLFGATAVMQTESWEEDGTYQVAVLVVWSNVLERAARAIATGEPFKVKKSTNKNALSVHEWIRKQDLASMIGPRQYIDNNGVRWFLGVAAESVAKRLSPGVRNAKRDRASKFAMQEALLSVTADYNMQSAAADLVRVYDAGKNKEGDTELTADAVGTLEQRLRADVKKFIIRGGQVLTSKTVKHPISGDDIYVVVYGYNPNHVAPALAAWTRNYATKTQALRHQTVERGRQAAVDDQVRQATNDPKDFQKGYKKQTRRFNKELQSRRPKQATKGTRVYNSGKQQIAPAKSTAGTFGGDVDVSDDF